MSYSRLRANAHVRLSGVMAQVYAWMTAGLLVTGAVAAATASTPWMMSLIFGNSKSLWVLLIAEIGLVLGNSAGIRRMAPAVAAALFLVYAALNGLTLSAVFLLYTRESIALSFLITAGMFGATSLYGYTTGRDLTQLGSLLFMALIGLLLASVVNLLVASTPVFWLITYAGVLIFVGLTAYDTQKIKRIAAGARDDATAGQVAIMGALELYLDFINLFLYLLQIFGTKRD